MKAMVTGGTGFVGSHLIDRLLAGGHEVTALVRSPAKAAGLEARGVRLVRGDLHDEAAIREAVRGTERRVPRGGAGGGEETRQSSSVPIARAPPTWCARWNGSRPTRAWCT